MSSMEGVLPEPMTPADCDLQDFGFMPLHVGRLRDSELVDLSTGDEFKAAVLLWAYAWHQVPAASLPDDDRILAKRSGAGADWPSVRAMALRGFTKCSDGRLYHPIIAQAACDAWKRHDSQQGKVQGQLSRQQKWRADLSRLSGLLRDVGVTPPERPSKKALVDLCKLHVPGFVDASVDANVDAHVDSARDAQVDGDAVSRETPRGVRETAKTQRETETETNTHTLRDGPPPPGVCVSMEKKVADAMRAAGMRTVDSGDPAIRELLRKGATVAMFEEAAAMARQRGKGTTFAFGVVRNKLADAAARAASPDVVPPITVPSKPGRDPAIVKLEADEKLAAKPSDETRRRLDELRGVKPNESKGAPC